MPEWLQGPFDYSWTPLFENEQQEFETAHSKTEEQIQERHLFLLEFYKQVL